MKRTGFKPPTLEQVQAAQRRRGEAAKRSAQRRTTSPRPTAHRRRNDAPWRAACIEQYGQLCAVPGCGSTRIQMDHIIARSQGGPSIVANGLPLCDDFSNGHHKAKTDGTLRIHPDWLHPTQLDWLRDNGHVTWLPDGSPTGRHCRIFAPTHERITA